MSWTARHLSFAGRLQLLASVISGITCFWSSAFVIPKAVTKAIISLCNSFLWKGNATSTHGARISWDAVCKPKNEGGLGLKNMAEANSISLLKLIWMFFFRADSIWVAWMKEAYLKDRNFWSLKFNYSLPWTWRKLLKLREKAYPLIKASLGNGSNIDFWHDNWSPFGNLLKFLGSSGPRLLGIPLDTKLADLYDGEQSGWRVGDARSDHHLQVTTHLTTLSLDPDREDVLEWMLGTVPLPSYSANKVWNHLQARSPEVPWFPLVWSFGMIPKCSFLMWLVIQNRAVTKDRLQSWGLNVDGRCILCNVSNESRDHLFFYCSFSSAVWTKVQRRLNLFAVSTSWHDVTSLVWAHRMEKERGTLLLLVWQVSIYELWLERNRRIHSNAFKSLDQILRQIDLMVRNRLSSLRVANYSRITAMFHLWFASDFL